eukprot:10714874-Prorocentrum_lima.AAC.1
MSSVDATGGTWSQIGTLDPDEIEDDERVCSGTTWLGTEGECRAGTQPDPTPADHPVEYGP